MLVLDENGNDKTDIIEGNIEVPPSESAKPDDWQQTDLNLRYGLPLKGSALKAAGKMIDPPLHVDTSKQTRLTFSGKSSQAPVA